MCWVLPAIWFSCPFSLGRKPMPVASPRTFLQPGRRDGARVSPWPVWVRSVFFLSQVLQIRFTACFRYSGRSFYPGTLWLVCHLSQGCYEQAHSLAVNPESATDSHSPHRPRGRTECACQPRPRVIPLGSMSSGF